MNIKKTVILIVEDDEPSYVYLESVLRKLAVTTIRAYDGKEAVDYCRENPEIDLVLMDLKMPVMDGLDATRRIKAARQGLPVIAITAYAFSGDEKIAMAAGCDDYLTKPVKKELLFKKLEKYGVTTIK
jgi:two-component system cell cycle response regulator DivK